jgi:N utilization substance protein B
MSTRHEARELALSYLYWKDFNGDLSVPLSVEFPAKNEQEMESYDQQTIMFASYLAVGTLEHIERIDEIIKTYSAHRAFDQIEKVAKNILRLSIFSLLYVTETHPSIIIDEAVKLSIEYSDDVSYKFINGLLEAVKKSEL